jgi:hypothetical protein
MDFPVLSIKFKNKFAYLQKGGPETLGSPHGTSFLQPEATKLLVNLALTPHRLPAETRFWWVKRVGQRHTVCSFQLRKQTMNAQ